MHQDAQKASKQVLFHVRTGNSNLAKFWWKIYAVYEDEKETSYSCKISEVNHFLPISMTTMHDTDSFIFHGFQ